MEKLITKIFAQIKKAPSDVQAYSDLFDLCCNIEADDFELAHDTNKRLRSCVSRAMKTTAFVDAFFGLYK